LFETRDGWRYTLWVTNLPAGERGGQARLTYIDAAHRVHTRVEDRIRTGKDCGIGHFPSRSLPANTTWLTASLLAATLLAWLRHLGLDGDLAKARRPGKDTIQGPLEHPAPGPPAGQPAHPGRPATPSRPPRQPQTVDHQPWMIRARSGLTSKRGANKTRKRPSRVGQDRA
jgi:hypothetical protein